MKSVIKGVLLFFVLTGFMSCIEDKDPVWYLHGEPAVVGYDGRIKTGYGNFKYPSGSGTTILYPGDCLLVNGSVDFGNQPSPNDTVISNFSFLKLGKQPVRFQDGDMEDTYTDSITTMEIYPSAIENMLFIYFEHKGYKDQQFDYEFICNTDSLISKDGVEFPKLYLRTRKANMVDESDVTIISNAFAFDMSSYVSEYEKDKKVNLYIQYKTGTKNGEDVYATYKPYPTEWYR